MPAVWRIKYMPTQASRFAARVRKHHRCLNKSFRARSGGCAGKGVTPQMSRIFPLRSGRVLQAYVCRKPWGNAIMEKPAYAWWAGSLQPTNRPLATSARKGERSAGKGEDPRHLEKVETKRNHKTHGQINKTHDKRSRISTADYNSVVTRRQRAEKENRNHTKTSSRKT